MSEASRHPERLAEVALKKQLRRLFEAEDKVVDAHLLLRDPTDDRYPKRPKEEGAPRVRWLLCAYYHLRQPHHLAVLAAEYLSWVPADHRGWDAFMDHNVVPDSARTQLRAEHAWQNADEEVPQPFRDFWSEYVAESEKAHLKVMKLVPLDRIIAIDPIGDGYHPLPQIFVEFDPISGPYDPDRHAAWLERPVRHGGQIDLAVNKDTHISHFPDPLPRTLYPPPVGFDHEVPNTHRRLSDKGGAELDALLQQDNAGSSPVAAREKASAELDGPALQFRKWRDDVVLPVFAEVVQRVRSAGFGARIAVLESPEGDRWSRGVESVELRVQRTTDYSMNPPHRSHGHVRYELEWHKSGIKTDMWPPPDGGSSGREHARPKPEKFTSVLVEGHVLGMLRRLG